MSGAASEDRGKGELSLDRCAVTAPDLGEINIMARISGADEAFWRAIDSGNAAGMMEWSRHIQPDLCCKTAPPVCKKL